MALTRIPIALVLSAGVLAAGCGKKDRAAPGARELTLAHVLQAEHPVHQAMARMAEIVAAETGGRLTIQLRHSGQQGAEKELIEKCQAGGIHMTKVSANALEANVWEMGLFALPFLFRDAEHYGRVLDGPVGQEILASLERVGLKGLVYYDAGARSFYANRPITGVESLRGLRVRVQQSPTMQAAMEALGARPVPIPFGAELTQALSKGQRVEAAENNPPSYWTEGHYEYCPYYYLDGHTRTPDVLVIHRGAWERLGPDDRRRLLAAARASAEFQKTLWRDEVERILARLAARGVQITRDVDTAPFVAAVRPVYDNLPDEKRKWVERIRAVK